MRLSLRSRLLVVPAIVVLGAVTLLVSLEHGSERKLLLAHESDLLLRMARELARTSEGPRAGWQATVDSLDSRLGIRATVIGGDGRVLADSRAIAAQMENHAGRPEVREALAGRAATAVRRSATLDEEFLYVAVPMHRMGASVLRLAEPIGIVSRLADALTRTTAGAAALALVVSLLVLGYVGERFVARVRRLQDVARRIGQGDQAARATRVHRTTSVDSVPHSMRCTPNSMHASRRCDGSAMIASGSSPT